MKKEQRMIKEKDLMEVLLKGWKETRQLTLDWIEVLSLEQLNKELSRPGLNSYTKHIYEMGEVQEIYSDVLAEKKPDMTKVTELTFEPEKMVVERKDELKVFLNEHDRNFYKAVGKVKDWQKKVSVFGLAVSKFEVVELLIRHETLHHGQFIAFGYLLGVPFPQSWIDAWALPTTKTGNLKEE